MKPQGIIYLPVLFFALLKIKRMRALTILSAIVITLNEYPHASVNAFNFFALLGASYTKVPQHGSFSVTVHGQ
jgi:Gpi18-like mannosyltransferase